MSACTKVPRGRKPDCPMLPHRRILIDCGNGEQQRRRFFITVRHCEGRLHHDSPGGNNFSNSSIGKKRKNTSGKKKKKKKEILRKIQE